MNELDKLDNPNVSRFRITFKRSPDLSPALFFESGIALLIRTAAAISLDWEIESLVTPDTDTVSVVMIRDPLVAVQAGVNPTVAVVVAGVIVSSVAALVVVITVEPLIEKSPTAISLFSIAVVAAVGYGVFRFFVEANNG